jgi:hypothetical protein
MTELTSLYPIINDKSPYDIFAMLLDSKILWNMSYHSSSVNSSTQQFVLCPSENVTSHVISVRNDVRNTSQLIVGDTTTYSEYDIEIIGDIAHVFHYCSIAILAVIMLEVS